MGDVEKLAEAFLEKFCLGVTLSAAALKVLLKHDWPGNVRELRNVIERSSIVVGSGREILAQHIIL
jgi:transcriptional regulator with PAS, ATPase and Fis domain